ncbi:MAG TPA: hypothetical protein DCQ30_01680 [Acidimicrobiaceae bacterium]|nr:hypothetical protein [Acidimicrobiaceae bacterium]
MAQLGDGFGQNSLVLLQFRQPLKHVVPQLRRGQGHGADEVGRRRFRLPVAGVLFDLLLSHFSVHRHATTPFEACP